MHEDIAIEHPPIPGVGIAAHELTEVTDCHRNAVRATEHTRCGEPVALYPEGLTRVVQVGLGLLVLLVNGWVYWRLVRRGGVPEHFTGRRHH